MSGLLADRLRRRKPLLLLTSGATTLLVYPIFLIITRLHTTLLILGGVALISALLALEALPARVRASGLAIPYALGVALFGGIAQFIVTALIKWTGGPMSAAWYIALACCLSFGVLMSFKEQPIQR